MAIDPKLVSIKQASDLPSAIPTNAGEFLFFEDNALQKSPMSDIYDRLNNGINGTATESNAPNTAAGFFRYIVTTPITTGSAWGIEVTQAELNNNWVFFNVKDGVITKDSKPNLSGRGITLIAKTSTVGEVDTHTITFSDASTTTFTVTNGTNAKLPLYSAIKSANIAAGTQFIDDENGFTQYRVKTGQTLLTTEKPANVVGVKVDRLSDTDTYKTYNLLENKYVARNSILSGTGDISVSSTYNVAYKVPVVPGQKYYIVGIGTIRHYFKYDSAGTYIATVNNGIASSESFLTIPSDTHFISYYLPNNTAGYNTADLSGVMLAKSDVAVPYLPPTLPRKSEYFELKIDAIKQHALKAKVNLNENKYVDRIKIYNELDSLTMSGTETVLVTDDYLKSVGIKEMSVQGSASPVGYTPQSGVTRVFPTPQDVSGKYVYVSAFFMTENPDFYPNQNQDIARGIYFRTATDAVVTSTILKSKITTIKQGLYRADAIVKLGNGLAKTLYFRIQLTGQNTAVFPIYISAPAFGMHSEYIEIDTLLPVPEGGQKIYFDVMAQNNAIRQKTLDQFQDKKVCLYGTSIEAGGYFNKVAATYNMRYLNFGNGGGGILWSNDPALNNLIMNDPTGVTPPKSWSATWAEKEAYLVAQGIPYTDQARLDCFDQNLLTNLDAELFLIGTSGINDRKSTTTHAFVIDKVNRQFDRATIYGAYNFVLRALFELKPTARVVIFGQHCFGWSNTAIVNEIQREVANDWNIPFLDWGNKMRFSNMPITKDGVTKSMLDNFAPDGAHPNNTAGDIMAEFLIRELATIY